MGYLVENWDEDGNPEVPTYVKEEPDCFDCNDAGRVIRFLAAVGERVENCPSCNPTPEQRAAQTEDLERQEAAFADIRRREAAGEMPF